MKDAHTEAHTPPHTPQDAVVFEFVSRRMVRDTNILEFVYATHFKDGTSNSFTELIEVSSGRALEALPEEFRKAMLEDLHLILGISYYKLFCAPRMQTDILLSDAQATFWNTVYQKGLGEFLYRNALPWNTVARFEASAGVARRVTTLATDVHKVLVGIGGGKDSAVALELLRDYECTGFVKEAGRENTLARAVAGVARVPVVSVQRTLDAQVLAGVPGAYAGHVPVSAIYAFLGVLEASLGGQAHLVLANEYSSNFGNVVHEGQEVNHKWSGSAEFEALFRTYVAEQLTPSVRYFSPIRPFYDLRVMKLFVEHGRKYFDVFSSCNRNFTHASTMGGSRWCGECPKCAFTFLMLAAFLPQDELIGIFSKNLLDDEARLPMYRDILGFGDMKPFDCVGTFDEARLALTMASENGWADALVVRTLLPQVGDVSHLRTEIFRAQRADTVPTRFRMVGMESALVLGYGKEGRTTETFLAQHYPHVRLGIADMKDCPSYLDAQEEYDIVIKTAGMPGALVTRQYTTATQLFFAQVPTARTIGVTGSKGKSTTATLIHDMLRAEGKKVRLIGNIGAPALQSVLDAPVDPDELCVFELSSYQLEDLDVSPHTAVVTSLFPEHLDYHGSLKAYYEAKRNIVLYQHEGDVFVCQNGYAVLDSWAAAHTAQVVHPEPLPFTYENEALLGEHMRANVALAYEVAKRFGVTEGTALRAVQSFKGLPHRLMHVGTFKGVSFYDDSISTTPESAIAGVRALERVDTILLGGVDRGYDFTELEATLRTHGVRTVILFPESGARMLVSEDGFRVLHTDSMDEAVRFAYEYTEQGKICLLSPAAPSYNLFTNFEARGDAFIEAVKKYGA